MKFLKSIRNWLYQNWPFVAAFSWGTVFYWSFIAPMMTPEDTVGMILVSLVVNFGIVFFATLIIVNIFGLLSIGYAKMKLKKPYALPLRAFSTGTVLYTWEDWHKDNKKEFPVRYFTTETLPGFLMGLVWSTKRAYYWVKVRTVKRHHKLDLRNKGYDAGWVDRDTIILYAAFKALELFVEEEMDGVFLDSVPSSPNDTDWDRQYWELAYEKEQELKALYEWWTKEYPNDAHSYEEEQHMLHRLIEARPYMWT